MSAQEIDVYQEIRATEQDLLAILNQCPMKCHARMHRLEIALSAEKIVALTMLLDVDDKIAKRQHGSEAMGDSVNISDADATAQTLKDAIEMVFFSASNTGQAEQDVLDMMERDEAFDPEKFDAAMDAFADFEQQSQSLPKISPEVTIADAAQSGSIVFSGDEVLRFLAGRGLNFPQSAHYTAPGRSA